MEIFQLTQLLSQTARATVHYQEFLRKPSLSLGLYTLPVGSVDPQKPHTEDEVYYIVSGRGSIKVGAEDRSVEPGSTIFVEAAVAHRFHSIVEDLAILVFFAPAEYTHKSSST